MKTHRLRILIGSLALAFAGCGDNTVSPVDQSVTADLSATSPPQDSAVTDGALAPTPDLPALVDRGTGPMNVPITVAPNGAFMFSPATVMIHAGDSVTWTWASSGHSVTSGTACAPDNKFCSPNDTNCAAGATSNAGATYTHTFTTAGVFPYFCTPHCGAGMVGSVTVQ